MEKRAALAPMAQPGILARAQVRQKTALEGPGVVADLNTVHEDCLPSSRKTQREMMKKQSMVHPDMQHASETMSPAAWKQTLKDIPIAVVGGGIGYGIGRTLAEIIGENVARSGQRPGWLKAMPLVTGGLSLIGAYSAAHARHDMAERRELADKA